MTATEAIEFLESQADGEEGPMKEAAGVIRRMAEAIEMATKGLGNLCRSDDTPEMVESEES